MMVSDSLITPDCGSTKKIVRASDGWLCGVSGTLVIAQRFMGWFLGDRLKDIAPPSLVISGSSSKDSEDSEACALVVNNKGHICLWESIGPCFIDAPFHGIGSGYKYALGALYAGAHPKDAIKIAIKCDPGSGGRIQTLNLKENAKK